MAGPYPYRCPRCRRKTGLKYVATVGTRSVGQYTGDCAAGPESVNRRPSCRFCGYVREGARA